MRKKILRRRLRRIENVIPEISLTPLIDTALTLLIIFMITTPMLQNAIKVDLPKGQAHEQGDIPQELVVFVDKQGEYFFNGEKVVAEDLVVQIQKAVGENKEQMVVVKADAHADYGTVIELVDQIKVVGGVSCVALATEAKRA